MEITGEQVIPQPRQLVWESLNDPEVLKACIMGCEAIELAAENEYNITMFAAVGPLKARFRGSLAVSDSDPPNRYKLTFSGSGGAIGGGKGTAAVRLSDSPEGTILQYTSSAQVEGRLAQIGSRLVDAAAKKIAGDFFKKFRVELSKHDAASPTD